MARTPTTTWNLPPNAELKRVVQLMSSMPWWNAAMKRTVYKYWSGRENLVLIMNMTDAHQFDTGQPSQDEDRTTDHEQHLSSIPIRELFIDQLILKMMHEIDSWNSISPTSQY
jgi:hypothetical protein